MSEINIPDEYSCEKDIIKTLNDVFITLLKEKYIFVIYFQ